MNKLLLIVSFEPKQNLMCGNEHFRRADEIENLYCINHSVNSEYNDKYNDEQSWILISVQFHLILHINILLDTLIKLYNFAKETLIDVNLFLDMAVELNTKIQEYILGFPFQKSSVFLLGTFCSKYKMSIMRWRDEGDFDNMNCLKINQ